MKTAEARQPVHIGKVVRNARVFNFRHAGGGPLNDSALLEVVERLFALLEERRIDYLLVGGIALLQYVEGRNTEDIDLIMALSSLDLLPELRQVSQKDDFARADFQGLQIDLLLTRNPLFDEVRRRHATRQPFAEREIPCATPEGLVLLKLYALPSLYRQGNVTRAALYETDVLTLMHRHRVDPEPLLAELEPHLSATDLKALRQIVAEIRQRIELSGSRFTS
ncbi:MAG: hypothetical protein QOF89_6112 [Acidobacteriota bacterium]|jgi:predicted nucleotidyltransferase|nr:hypothetical protein [Acidobacteriota bacterium]